MKKSFIRVLTLSLALSSVGFISSCKDYDDDLRTEMNSQIAILDQKVDKEVQTDVKDLQEQLKALQEAMEKLKQCNCGVDKPWTSDLAAEVTKLNATIDSKYAELDGKIGEKLNAAQVNAIVEALLPDLTKYYTKSEIDALLAGLNTGDDCNCDIETLKTKLASWVTSQITSTVTKDYVTALLTGEYASQAEFEDLKTKVDNITSVGCLCGDLATSISNLENRIKNAEDRLTALDGEDGKIAQLFTLCEELKQYDATLLAKITTLEGQVQSLIQNSATKADVQVLKDLYNNLEPRVKALEEKIATLATKDELAAVQLKADMAYAQAEMNLEQIDLLLKNYYKMKTILNELGDNYQELSQKLSETIGNLQTLSEKHEADMELAAADRDAIRLLLNQKITAVQGQISTLTGDIEDLSAELAANVVDLNKKIFNNWSQIISTNEYIAEVEEALNERIDNIDELMAYYYTLINDIVNVEIANLNSRYDELSDKFGDYYTKEAIENRLVPIEIKLIDLDGELITLSDKVAQLQQQHADDVDALNDRITEEIIELTHTLTTQLNDNVDALNERIDGLQDQINDLTEELNGVKKDVEALKKMITSIEVQATNNNFFGMINTPVGLQTNILSVWFGKALNKGTFPSYGNDAAYIWDSQALDDEYDIVGDPRNDYFKYASGQTLMDNTEGNAGKIYMTVNPSNLDLDGQKDIMTLVNSQDVESPFKLGELKASNKKLQFGITRAGNNNGFYEAPVTLSPDDVYKVNVELADGIKSAVSDVVKNVTHPRDINAGKIASVVKDQLVNLRTDALGLKAWVEDENRGVYSKYGIAGVAVKSPIAYSSFKDFDYKTVPGYERAVNLINSTANSLKDRIKINIGGKFIDDINAINIQKIEIPELTKEQKAKFSVAIDTTIVIDGLQYYLDFSKEVEVPVKFDKDLKIPVDGIETSVPVNISKEISVDMSDVTITSPAVIVSGNAFAGTDDDPKATLRVECRNARGVLLGYCDLPLSDIKVKAEGGLKDGSTITLNGTPVAKLEYSDTFTGTASGEVNYTLKVDETVKTTVNIQDWIYFGDEEDEYGHKTKKSVRIWITRDFSDAIEDIWGTVQGSMDGVNDMLAQLKTVQDDANDLLAQINSLEETIADAVDDVADRLKSYLDRVNDKFVNLINSANDKLQPVLIGTDSYGTKFLSRAKNQPSWIGSSLTFYATNYLAEVIAPACMRHVAVTNVYNPNGTKASNAKSLADKVNNSGDMNTVLGGRQMRIVANNFQKGYIYEVAYSALDYTGKQVTHKYYVRVK